MDNYIFCVERGGISKVPHLQWTTIGWVLVLLCTLVTSSMTSVMVFRLEHLPSGSQFIMWNCVTWWAFPDCSKIYIVTKYHTRSVHILLHKCRNTGIAMAVAQNKVLSESWAIIVTEWVLQLDWVLSYLCQYCSITGCVTNILQIGVAVLNTEKNFTLDQNPVKQSLWSSCCDLQLMHAVTGCTLATMECVMLSVLIMCPSSSSSPSRSTLYSPYCWSPLLGQYW